MTQIILGCQPAHPGTISVHDADLVHGLDFEELTRVNDMPGESVCSRGKRNGTLPQRSVW